MQARLQQDRDIEDRQKHALVPAVNEAEQSAQRSTASLNRIRCHRSIGVRHADLPVIGITNIDRY